MKYKIIILSLLGFCISGNATLILTDNSPHRKQFIALVYEENEVRPVYVIVEPVPREKGLGWGYTGQYLRLIVPYESEFPSLLLGDERPYAVGEKMALNIQGTDMEGYSWILESYWLKTKQLGWVHAGNYPFVYSSELGWIYIYEKGPSNFEIYVYAEELWQGIDLEEEWTPNRWIPVS